MRFESLLDESLNNFRDFSVGSTVPGGTIGASVSKSVWSDAFNGSSLIGTSTSLNGGAGAIIPTPAGIKKLFVTDTWTINAGAAMFNTTNTFTQTTPRVATPEPASLLGLLAFGGLGLGLKRKKQS